MAYMVTARKWRPQTFAEVVGQQHISHTLENALKQGRIAHAYLFSGPRGVGKTTMARILAKALNCEKGPTPLPCNQCSLCQEINAGSAIDVLEIDGASNRGIDEIRELRESVRYAPARGKYRVYIIDEVHMLTKEAFNALLKTLEEPPAHVVFIFATTEPERVLHTIISRCQHFTFHRIALRDIITQLQTIAQHEGIAISADGLHLIAKSADGSMRDAQSLFDQLVAFCGKSIRVEDIASILGIVGQDLLYQFMEAILARKRGQVLQLVHEFFLHGHDAKELCGGLLEYIRNLLVAKTGEDLATLIELPAETIAELQKQGERVSEEELHALFDMLSNIEAGLKESSYPRFLLETTLLKMASLKPFVPLEDILGRLAEFEKRLGLVDKKKEHNAHQHPETSLESPLSPLPAEKVKPEPNGKGVVAEESAKPIGKERVEAKEAHIWTQIVQEVRRRRISLGAILQEGTLLRIDKDTCELGFQSENSFFRESVLNLENLKLISEVVEEVLGERKKIKIRDSSTPDKEKRPVKNGESTDNQRTLLDREILRDALEIFDGRIIETRTYQQTKEVASENPFEEGEALDIEEKDHG